MKVHKSAIIYDLKHLAYSAGYIRIGYASKVWRVLKVDSARDRIRLIVELPTFEQALKRAKKELKKLYIKSVNAQIEGLSGEVKNGKHKV